jgi:hypothetical protein
MCGDHFLLKAGETLSLYCCQHGHRLLCTMTENEYTTGTLEVLLCIFFLASSSEETCHLPENSEANLSDHLYYITPNLTLWANKNVLRCISLQ